MDGELKKEEETHLTVDPWKVHQEGEDRKGRYGGKGKWTSRFGVGTISQRRGKEIDE